MEVAMPQTFNGSSERVIGFVTVYKLYLRTKMRNIIVKKQIQWVLMYIQKRLGDV